MKNVTNQREDSILLLVTLRILHNVLTIIETFHISIHIFVIIIDKVGPLIKCIELLAF